MMHPNSPQTIIPQLPGWHDKSHGAVGRKMIPASETAKANGWDRGNPWIASSKWKRPKMIQGVRNDCVHMSQMYRGALGGLPSVRAFPADVHRVDAPQGGR